MDHGKNVSENVVNISCASGVVSGVVHSSRTMAKDKFSAG
jgi:hypothetical protein